MFVYAARFGIPSRSSFPFTKLTNSSLTSYPISIHDNFLVFTLSFALLHWSLSHPTTSLNASMHSTLNFSYHVAVIMDETLYLYWVFKYLQFFCRMHFKMVRNGSNSGNEVLLWPRQPARFPNPQDYRRPRHPREQRTRNRISLTRTRREGCLSRTREWLLHDCALRKRPPETPILVLQDEVINRTPIA